MKRSTNSGSSLNKKLTTINPHIDINNDDFTDSESIKFNMDLDNSNFINQSNQSTPKTIIGGGAGGGGGGENVTTTGEIGGGGGVGVGVGSEVTFVKSYGALDQPCFVDGSTSSLSSSLPGNHQYLHHHHHHPHPHPHHLHSSSTSSISSSSQYAHPIENYHNATQFGHRHFSKPSTFHQNGLYDDDHHLHQPHPSSINSYSIQPSNPPDPTLTKRAYVNVGFQDDERLTSNNPTKRNPETISTHGRIMPSRDPVRWVDLETRYGKVPFKRQMSTTAHLTRSAGSCCSHNTLFNLFSSLFPILSWLRSYDVKSDLVNDVFAGLTAAALHLPQGMAYGLLAGVSPINGLYVSFFPVIIYALMGTSRHGSIGTFAIASIMTRNTMNKLGVPPGTMSIGHGNNKTIDFDYIDHPTPLYTSLEVATALCFVAGAIRLVMGIFRLGVISILLSDQLVSAFSTGAAIHVATSQIADLFGWKSPKTTSGPFKLIYAWIGLFNAASTTNWVTTSLSIVCIVILCAYKEFIDEPMKKKFHLPVSVPIDLFILISSTAASYLLRMNVNYGVSIMGNIPKGLPSITTPNFDLSVKLLPDGFAVAMVTYAIGLSLGKIFAKKHRYQIRPSQELIALGTADLVSSFFSCYPCSASLSRTPVQEIAGSRTQLTALISSLIMLLILLFLGPLFFYLPKCILSCIILVALKNMLIQIGDIKSIWSVSRLEGICYLITFLSTILLDVDLGLIVGVLVAIIMALVRFMAPNVSLLGQLPNTEIYVEKNYFQQAIELDGIKIFRFSSALFFLNTESFRENLFKFCFNCAFFELMEADDSTRKLILGKTTAVIIDCSTISYIDSPGVEMILEIFNGLRDIRVRCYLASCPAILLSMLERTRFTEKITAKRSPIFPTIHDAVIAESLSIPL